MKMRTELGKVRGLGSAKAGTHHFWMERVTAIAGLPLVIYLVYFIVAHLGSPRADIVNAIKNPVCAVALLLAIIANFWHMALGLQVVVEDYVHSEGRKLVILLTINLVSFFLGAVALYSILKMSFGS